MSNNTDRPVPHTALNRVATPKHFVQFNLAKAATLVMEHDPRMGREMWKHLLDGDAGEEARHDAEEHLWYIFWEVVENLYVPHAEIVEEFIAEIWPDYKTIVGIDYIDGPVLLRNLEVLAPAGTYEMLSDTRRPSGQ